MVDINPISAGSQQEPPFEKKVPESPISKLPTEILFKIMLYNPNDFTSMALVDRQWNSIAVSAKRLDQNTKARELIKFLINHLKDGFGHLSQDEVSGQQSQIGITFRDISIALAERQLVTQLGDFLDKIIPAGRIVWNWDSRFIKLVFSEMCQKLSRGSDAIKILMKIPDRGVQVDCLWEVIDWALQKNFNFALQMINSLPQDLQEMASKGLVNAFIKDFELRFSMNLLNKFEPLDQNVLENILDESIQELMTNYSFEEILNSALLMAEGTIKNGVLGRIRSHLINLIQIIERTLKNTDVSSKNLEKLKSLKTDWEWAKTTEDVRLISYRTLLLFKKIVSDLLPRQKSKATFIATIINDRELFKQINSSFSP